VRTDIEKLTSRGWQLVRLRKGSKTPLEKGWPALSPTADDFKPGENVGVRFGPDSGGLVDVDLDTPTARQLAASPAFGLNHLVEFGRESLPAGQRGHRLVTAPDAPNRSRVFGLRSKAARTLMQERGLGLTVVELRASSGSQTAVPPSIIKHDKLVWSDDPDDIPTMAWEELETRVGRLAFAALAAALYPTDNRDAFALSLYGALVAAGVNAPTADAMVRAIAVLAGDDTDRDHALDHDSEGLDAFLALTGLEGIGHHIGAWLGLAGPVNDLEHHPEHEPGKLSAADLERLLEVLDPYDFGAYDDYFAILSAAHHATGGDKAARELVVKWFGTNTDYGPDKRDDSGTSWPQVVRRSWDGLKVDRDGPTNTLGTLLSFVREADHGLLAAEISRKLSSSAFDEPLPKEPRQAPGLSIAWGDQIKSKPLRPLWPGRIFRGKLTCFAGEPEQAKSLITVDIAARVSRGMPWPDGSGNAPIGRALILAAEDDEADTIKPRLLAAGADVGKVGIIRSMVLGKGGKERGFSIADDIPRLKEAMRAYPDIRVLVVDPVNSFMGTSREHDSFRDSDVRAVLNPLKEFAEAYDVAVILVTHFRKGNGKAMKAVDLVMGSLAFVALSRSAWAFIGEKDDLGHDTGRRMMARIKQNVTSPTDAITYEVTGDEVTEGISAPKVVWGQVVTGKADDFLNGSASTSDRRGHAEAFLAELLSSGPVAAATITAKAKEAGHSKKTLQRAKSELEIESYQDGKGKERQWYWRLPDTEVPTY